MGGEGGESARTGPHLFTVVGGAGTVDVEAGDDLGDGVVETEDDLDVTGWVLGDDGDGVLGADCGAEQALDSFRR